MTDQYKEFAKTIKLSQNTFALEQAAREREQFEITYLHVREACLEAAKKGNNFIDTDREITNDDVKALKNRYIELQFKGPTPGKDKAARWLFAVVF
jgi:hypothetical protein